MKCLEIGDREKQNEYQNKLVEVFKLIPENEKPFSQMAYLGWKLGVEDRLVTGWLKHVEWADLGSYYFKNSSVQFKDLRAHIAYVKLRAAYGFDDSINVSSI